MEVLLFRMGHWAQLCIMHIFIDAKYVCWEPDMGPSQCGTLQLRLWARQGDCSWSLPSWTSLLLKMQFSFSFFLIFFFFLAIMTPRCCAWAFCCSTSWGVPSSYCGAFSCSAAQAPERGLSSCGPGARLPCSMWNPSSWTRDQTRGPCISSKFSTTGPPGKSQFLLDSDMSVFSFCLNTLEMQSTFLNWVYVFIREFTIIIALSVNLK